MARRYSRDNRGRFASGGSSSGGGGKVGATARGGRLKAASGNKRATQTTKAAAAKPSGAIAGKVKRNPAAAGKIGQQAKPQSRRPDQAEVNIKGRFTGQAGKRFDASIDRAVKQVKASERARLMKPKEQVKAERAARAETKRQAAAAKPKRTRTAESLRASRAKQIEKRRSITTNPAGERASAAAKMAANAARTQQRATAFLKAGGKGTATPAAPKAARRKGKEKVDDSKVSRVIGRVNKVVRGSEEKTGVKRLNAIQVGVRAKSFLARKEGGNVGMLNQKGQPEAFASVRKAMTKPPKYSTQSPNRNKPGRFNDLGQDKVRAKARADAMTGRERIAKANELAAAKAKERKGKMPTGAMSRRSLPQLGAPRAPGYAKGPRQAGTMAKPKTSSTPVSSTVARTRTQAKAAQRNRREQILDRARTGVTGLGSMRKNPRIKRSDTGMRQLSLTGKAKTLYKFKPIKRR